MVGKKEIKLSFFCRQHECQCRKCQIIDKKYLELISNYGKVAGYKTYTKNYIVFLYTSNELLEFKIKNITSLTFAPKKNEVIRHKSNKICARSIWGKLQNFDEQSQRRCKWMESYSMFMNRQTQYC